MKTEILKKVLQTLSIFEDIELDSLYIKNLEGFKGVYEFNSTIIFFGNSYTFTRIFLKNKPLNLQITEFRNEIRDIFEIYRGLYEKTRGEYDNKINI